MSAEKEGCEAEVSLFVLASMPPWFWTERHRCRQLPRNYQRHSQQHHWQRRRYRWPDWLLTGSWQMPTSL
jgi:hypothetical protein